MSKILMYTAAAIEDIVNAHLSVNASAREKHFFRESLLNLVRLSRAEYMAEIQNSVGKVMPVLPSDSRLLA